MASDVSHTLVSRSAADRVIRSRKILMAEAISAAIVGADAAAIIATSIASGIAYHEAVYSEAGSLLSYLRVGVLAAIVVVVVNLLRGEYRLVNFLHLAEHGRRIAQLWTLTFVILLLLGFLSKATVTYSRGWIVLFYFSGLPVLFFLKYAAVEIVRRSTGAGLISTKRVFLLGSASEIEQFLARCRPWAFGVEIVGCQFFSASAEIGPPRLRRHALQRDLRSALRNARHLEPNAVFILAHGFDMETIDRCVETMLLLPSEIHLGPDYVLSKYHNAQLARVGPLTSLQVTRLPLSRFELLQKRAMDFVFSALGLLVLAPLFAVVALLIKLDSPGPIFFLQRRYGFNEQPFRIIKFRTMRALDDGPVVQQATRDDPRITRVGRWLRRFNVDELPQLINVLKGEMSLVGPRPHALAHNREFERVIARYARRHNVKPGLTGWAQIHGLRGETDTNEKMQKRVEYDLFYIDNWSIDRDLLILIKTVLSPASYRNAY
jgi:Undecaprenyl-phosphate glucose phosphotransferase